MRISFRPHHFLCTIAFEGMGYSPEFVKNYLAIAQALRADEELSLLVVTGADSVCQACPHKRGKACTKEETIQRLDSRHRDILGLNEGDVLTWKQGKEKLRDHMSLENFHFACEGCEWKSLGVCETALLKLRKEDVTKKADA